MSGHCVTNDVADLRSCTIRGEHVVAGEHEGWRYDRTLDIEVPNGKPCTGCLPREAEVGGLCHHHVLKLEDAFGDLVELIGIMWTDRTNGVRDTNDRVSSSGGPRWPLQESRVHASWIMAAMSNVLTADRGEHDLRVLDGAHGLSPSSPLATVLWRVRATVAAIEVARDELASTPRGAEALVRFVQIVADAARRFPLFEQPHRVVGLRCPKCLRSGMVWRPPLMHRGDVVVRCEWCHHVEPHEWIEQYADVVRLKPTRA